MKFIDKATLIYKEIASSILNFFLPQKCLICGIFIQESRYYNSKEYKKLEPITEDIESVFKILIKSYICDDCLQDLVLLESPICPVCGLMFKSRTGEDHLCGKCIDAPKSFSQTRTVGVYTGILRKLIHQFKYRNKISLAKPLSIILFFTYIKFFSKNSFDYILPIPLHIKKMRKRGFNQSYLLLKYWQQTAKKYNIKLPNIMTDKQIIKRIKNTKQQAGLAAPERQKNIKNSFIIKSGNKIYGKSILIIDDVFTTGVTVNECGKVLKKAGAEKIEILTLSRGII